MGVQSFCVFGLRVHALFGFPHEQHLHRSSDDYIQLNFGSGLAEVFAESCSCLFFSMGCGVLLLMGRMLVCFICPLKT